MRKTIVLLTGAITLTLLLAVPVVFAHGGMDSMMGHGGMGMGMMSGMMFLTGILWLVLLGLLIYGLVKWLSGKKQDANDTAMQILKERYARGEITEQEYETMKKKLQE